MPRPVDVRRSGDRFVTRTPGIQTWHSFSFGPHYDPGNISFGRLLLHDEHRLDPHAGFDPHPHRELDILTWVLDGELVHEDQGGTTTVPAGGFQRLLAGPGVVHAERAGPAGARFVQLWLAPEQRRTSWSYDHGQTAAGVQLTALSPEVGVARVRAERPVLLPRAPLLHLFVTRGTVRIAGHDLREGDASRLVGQLPDPALQGAGEVLLVAMHSTSAGE